MAITEPATARTSSTRSILVYPLAKFIGIAYSYLLNLSGTRYFTNIDHHYRDELRLLQHKRSQTMAAGKVDPAIEDRTGDRESTGLVE